MSRHNRNKKKFEIEDRRRQIALMLAREKTQQEIADKLGYDRTTISKDIKAMTKAYQDDTDCDLDYCYRRSVDKIQEAERIVWGTWEILTDGEKKDRYCQTAKTIADLAKDRFLILKDGPGLKRINAINKMIIEEENNRNKNVGPQ